jgi:hypothetical protein
MGIDPVCGDHAQTFAVMASGARQENIKPESSSPEITL